MVIVLVFAVCSTVGDPGTEVVFAVVVLLVVVGSAEVAAPVVVDVLAPIVVVALEIATEEVLR